MRKDSLPGNGAGVNRADRMVRGLTGAERDLLDQVLVNADRGLQGLVLRAHPVQGQAEQSRGAQNEASRLVR